MVEGTAPLWNNVATAFSPLRRRRLWRHREAGGSAVPLICGSGGSGGLDDGAEAVAAASSVVFCSPIPAPLWWLLLRRRQGIRGEVYRSGCRGSGWLVPALPVGCRCRLGGGCPASSVWWATAAGCGSCSIGEAKELVLRWAFDLRLPLRGGGVPSSTAVEPVMVLWRWASPDLGRASPTAASAPACWSIWIVVRRLPVRVIQQSSAGIGCEAAEAAAAARPRLTLELEAVWHLRDLIVIFCCCEVLCTVGVPS